MLVKIGMAAAGLLLWGYSFLRYRFLWSRGKMPVSAYYVLQGILAGGAAASFLFVSYVTNDLTVWGIQLSVSLYLAVMLFTPLFSMLRGAVRMIGKRGKRRGRIYRFFNHPSKVSWIILGITLALGAGVFLWSKIPRTYEDTVVCKKEMAADSFTVITVSDLKLGAGMTRREVRMLFERLGQYQPDMLVFIGGLYSKRIGEGMRGFCDGQLKELVSRFPVYMVAGPDDTETNMGFIRKAGVRILQDDVIVLSNGVQLAGLRHREDKERKEVSYTCSLVDKNKPAIVFSYEDLPEEEKQLAGCDVLLHSLPSDGMWFMPKRVQITHLASVSRSMPREQGLPRSARG